LRNIRFLILGVLSIVCLMSARIAQADETEQRAFVLHASIGVGGPYANDFGDHIGKIPPTTAPFALVLRSTVYAPRSLGLELGGVWPSGVGANAIVDLVSWHSGRIHVVDPGIFHAFGKPLTSPDVSRNLDLSFGAGLDLFPFAWLGKSDAFVFSFDWRTYMPLNAHGADGKSVDVSDSMFREGQFWLRIGLRLWAI